MRKIFRVFFLALTLVFSISAIPSANAQVLEEQASEQDCPKKDLKEDSYVYSSREEQYEDGCSSFLKTYIVVESGSVLLLGDDWGRDPLENIESRYESACTSYCESQGCWVRAKRARADNYFVKWLCSGRKKYDGVTIGYTNYEMNLNITLACTCARELVGSVLE